MGKRVDYNIITREAYYFLRDWVEPHLSSSATFALCRAVEFYNGQLSTSDLSQEIAGKRQPAKSILFFRPKKNYTATCVNYRRQISLIEETTFTL